MLAIVLKDVVVHRLNQRLKVVKEHNLGAGTPMHIVKDKAGRVECARRCQKGSCRTRGCCRRQ
jgi:hypothetical protein